MRIRTSADAGATWSPTTVFENAYGAAIAICGDEVYLVFVRDVRAGRRVIDLAFGQVGGDSFAVVRVAGGRGSRSQPDVACTDGRLFVSWYEREGGPVRRWVANALRTTHVFGDPADLGLDRTNYDGFFSPRGFHLGASGDTASAVFGAADGTLRLKRWSIGPAPDYDVTPHATDVVGGGRERCPAQFPVIGADGESVAIAWEKNGGILARVSTNGGVSWDAVREITEVDCEAIVDGGAVPQAMAVRGSRMVLTWIGCGFDGCTNVISRSRDGFEHSSWRMIGEDQTHVVGFMKLDGRVRLADAFSNERRVRFRHAT